MANDCLYEMKIKGSKKAINRVIKCLKANYNYGEEKKPRHKHFFRIFECYDDGDEIIKNEDGTFTKFVYGECAWSVRSCMLSGSCTYYEDIKKGYPKIFMGTDLLEQSKDCEIEVFSEELGMEFSEHYLFKNGEMLLDNCIDITQAGYDSEGKVTKEIDWDTYDGDAVILNDNRENGTWFSDFKWSL